MCCPIRGRYSAAFSASQNRAGLLHILGRAAQPLRRTTVRVNPRGAVSPTPPFPWHFFSYLGLARPLGCLAQANAHAQIPRSGQGRALSTRRSCTVRLTICIARFDVLIMCWFLVGKNLTGNGSKLTQGRTHSN
ncbi:hypothetical protein OG21DRAFT_1510444 [Imleria badia]|nr:hypothetical protein OG21DRAFT_1510444 [Imleria badia]